MYLAGADHGTSCAGVIGGEANAVLTVGAAPACQLLPIQWESEGPSLLITDSKMLTALTFIGDKVDVLSNSWGSVPRNNWPMQVVNRIKQLALTGGRRGRGIVFLWAAGNENCPISHTSTQLIPHDHGWRRNQNGTFTWVGPPRARVFENNLVGIPGVMHVAALASTAQRSHYSNYGTGIGVCAPSSNSHAYFRIVPFPGLGITTTSGETGFVTEEFGGTSSATPLVAGIVGLVLSANPDLSALEVISILKQTASKDLSMQGYPRTPLAPFDPDTSWDISPVAPFDSGAFQNIGSPDGTWSPWFGHGKVNAEAAVAEAISRRTSGGTTTPATMIRHASTPALAIPDNNAAGVSNTINVPESARIGAIKIAVDIAHPFIGDLLVTLGTPSGSQVVLHNRNGGNADNIQRTFDLVSTPGLSALLGQTVQGNWTLTVQDQAPSDTGTLNRWELEIAASAGAESEASESPGTNIPDNNPAGIERSLTINDNGSIKELAVAVDITHTFIGDLRVSLVAPSGTSINLHNQSGGGTDNLITTFDTANTTALQVLRGQAAQGAWKLRVADLAGQDIGKLNRWALRITRQA
jgi:subtilisin-like proprotein convertase family protein